MKTIIRLVIFDIDNTLYNWVSYYSASFYSMFEKLLSCIGGNRDQLLDEFQEVHRTYGNTEVPNAMLEIYTVKELISREGLEQVKRKIAPAIHVYNKTRKQTLIPYYGIVSFLKELFHNGTILILHTEATINNAEYKISRLNVGNYIRGLYASETNNQKDYKYQYKNKYKIRLIKKDERKPNPKIIHEIANTYEREVDEILYVGDSVNSDIIMANEAGVHSAWAKYGKKYKSQDWRKLVRITHWDEKDFAKYVGEKNGKSHTTPETILENNIYELKNFYHFVN